MYRDLKAFSMRNLTRASDLLRAAVLIQIQRVWRRKFQWRGESMFYVCKTVCLIEVWLAENSELAWINLPKTRLVLEECWARRSKCFKLDLIDGALQRRSSWWLFASIKGRSDNFLSIGGGSDSDVIVWLYSFTLNRDRWRELSVRCEARLLLSSSHWGSFPKTRIQSRFC